MAQLIDWLALSGARDSSGDPVSSGFAWFYEWGGGTSTATVFADAAATEIATQPVALDEAGRAEVWTIAPVRIVIQDAAGADVTDVDQANVNRAEAVSVDSENFSSAWLDGVLEALASSTGGPDAMYMESAGATARTIEAKFSELSISVKDFGAAGDGLADDTTAIQAAINRVGFLGGGEVYFPPGTYKYTSALTNTVDGVSLRGSGRTSTVIKGDGGISLTGCDGFALRDFQLLTTSSSVNGTGLTMSTCTTATISNVYVSGWYVSVAASSCSEIAITGSKLRSPGAGAGNGRSLTLTSTSSVTIASSQLDTFGAASRGIELLGSSSGLTVTGSWLTSTGVSVRFDAALTGTAHRFVGNSFAYGTAAFSFGGATMPSAFYQAGNGVDGYKVGLLTGATVTPDLTLGSSITVDATTTGSAYTVAVPTPPPSALDYGVFMKLTLYCHAGGAITGWGLAAGYHVSSAPSTTDTQRTTYLFNWDPDGSVWREVSRSVTT